MTELEKTAKKVIEGDFDAQLELIFAFADLGYSITIKKFKEEKKMLNVDKYREELLEEMERNKKNANENDNDNLFGMKVYFRSIEAVMKRHGGGSTSYFSDDVKWLFSEYEPPLLENGDGLKPGDWIMVRKNEDGVWEEQQFLSYLDGWFYARKIVPDGWSEKIDRFRQARLPEEGE